MTKNYREGRLYGVTYDDDHITAVTIRDTDDKLKTFVPESDRYKWHDISKNPKDMPDHYCYVLAWATTEANKGSFFCPVIAVTSAWLEQCWQKHGVIAWKEIELFDTEEKDYVK